VRNAPPAARPPAPPLTPAALERSALWHLSRRALTTAELRSALLKKAQRHAPTPESGAWIDALLARFASSRLLDDASTARGRVESGRARGWSRRRIEQRLRGVDAETRADAFAHADDPAARADGVTAELAAARVFVAKKSLRAKHPDKAMAALARQGFAYAVAKAALAEPPPEDSP